MDEARRFLRHVLPGAAFLLQLVFIDAVCGMRLLLTKVLAVDKESAIVVVLGGFVAAGALGFLLAQFYFCAVSWWRWVIRPVNHATTVDRLHASAGSADDNGAESSLDLRAFRQSRAAWIRMSSWWYIRSGSCRDLANAERRAQALADLVHTCGAMLMTAPVGMIASLAVVWFKADPTETSRWGLDQLGQTALCGMAWLLLALLHLRNYLDVRLRFEGFIDGIVASHGSGHECRPPDAKW